MSKCQKRYFIYLFIYLKPSSFEKKRKALWWPINADLGPHSLFPGSLSAHFLSMDRYRSSAHFADYQVRSSLNCSKKNSGLLLEKSAKTLYRS